MCARSRSCHKFCHSRRRQSFHRLQRAPWTAIGGLLSSRVVNIFISRRRRRAATRGRERERWQRCVENDFIFGAQSEYYLPCGVPVIKLRAQHIHTRLACWRSHRGIGIGLASDQECLRSCALLKRFLAGKILSISQAAQAKFRMGLFNFPSPDLRLSSRLSSCVIKIAHFSESPHIIGVLICTVMRLRWVMNVTKCVREICK